MTNTFSDYLQAFSQSNHLSSLTGIGRGIEREALRVHKEGRLSDHPHYKALGSALTNPYITTDYSETLLEFITPVSDTPEKSIEQLRDIQRFTLSNIDGELLWPMSMPCFVEDDNKIPLAQYGSSNIGKMKTVYRQGLKNRYGSMMQVISGIHFNFSFSKEFWQTLQKIDQNETPLNDYISDRYFNVLRNYKRFCWLIPYLYGSSPAICPSFLQNKSTSLPFKKSSKGYVYLEHATSLRMSDLGYTNSEQSSLKICYNDLKGYLDGVREAINLPSQSFDKIGVKVNGEYQQLNTNVLQIENELYAPVRPKQVSKSGEKPSEALANRGVEYIEVRALDVNPFADTGIDVEQVYFLDVFLTFCALNPNDVLDCAVQQAYEKNMDEVVVRGRDPKLILTDGDDKKSVKEWGESLFSQFKLVAELLDNAYGTQRYSEVVDKELEKIRDPQLTPSAKILNMVVDQERSLTDVALKLASEYREDILGSDYSQFSAEHIQASVEQSLVNQNAIEQEDELSFDDFLKDYFQS